MTLKRPAAALFLILFAFPLNANADEGTTAGVSVKVASISFVPMKFDLSGNANRLEASFRKAKAGGAQIAVAPEGALDGYVVNEIIAGEVPAERINEVTVPIDGPVIKRFQKLASELELCMVFGLAEKIGEDVFNCAVFIDREGKIRGKYHKMQFAEGYHPSWWYNRLGVKSRAFDTPYGRCGILICNDRWNPMLAKIPVLDGARFLIIPSFGSRSKAQDEAVLSRGKENGGRSRGGRHHVRRDYDPATGCSSTGGAGSCRRRVPGTAQREHETALRANDQTSEGSLQRLIADLVRRVLQAVGGHRLEPEAGRGDL
jgi:predicted amidohydrolase